MQLNLAGKTVSGAYDRQYAFRPAKWIEVVFSGGFPCGVAGKKTRNPLADIPQVEAIDYSYASESIRLDLPFMNSDYIHALTIGRGVTEQGHHIQDNRQLPVSIANQNLISTV